MILIFIITAPFAFHPLSLLIILVLTLTKLFGINMILSIILSVLLLIITTVIQVIARQDEIYKSASDSINAELNRAVAGM